ncbi:MAG: SH3 domain-containing protein [Phototrophicaceae bacterium]
MTTHTLQQTIQTMKRFILCGLGMVMLFMGTLVTHAQDAQVVELIYPPAVYTVAGEVDLVGTVNGLGLLNYFLEIQPLGDNLQPLEDESALWFPITLPLAQAVLNGQLGTWDTTTVADGVYAVRLTVNRLDELPLTDVSSPIRVDNTPQTTVLDEDEAVNAALIALTATAEGQGSAVIVPTQRAGGLLPTPTAFTDGDLTGEIITVSNLREGDSTSYNILSGLPIGEVVRVIGKSARGNGWLKVELNNGQQGWVAPSVIRLDGDSFGVPSLNPPASPTPLATATPIPTPAPTLSPFSDGIITGMSVDREIKQGESFQLFVTVQNVGGDVYRDNTLFCNIEPMNAEASQVIGSLQPNEMRTYTFTMSLASGAGTTVRIICATDFLQNIVEGNDTNNTRRIDLAVK